MIKPERPDSTISLKGLDYVDVSGLATKDYKVSFFTYKEGLYNAKVRQTSNCFIKSALWQSFAVPFHYCRCRVHFFAESACTCPLTTKLNRL